MPIFPVKLPTSEQQWTSLIFVSVLASEIRYRGDSLENLHSGAGGLGPYFIVFSPPFDWLHSGETSAKARH